MQKVQQGRDKCSGQEVCVCGWKRGEKKGLGVKLGMVSRQWKGKELEHKVSEKRVRSRGAHGQAKALLTLPGVCLWALGHLPQAGTRSVPCTNSGPCVFSRSSTQRPAIGHLLVLIYQLCSKAWRCPSQGPEQTQWESCQCVRGREKEESPFPGMELLVAAQRQPVMPAESREWQLFLSQGPRVISAGDHVPGTPGSVFATH